MIDASWVHLLTHTAHGIAQKGYRVSPFMVLGSLSSSLANFPWLGFFTGLVNLVGLAAYSFFRIKEYRETSQNKIKHKREAYQIWSIAQRRRAKELPVEKLDPATFIDPPDIIELPTTPPSH